MSTDAAHPNPEVAKRLAHIYTLHKTEIDFRLGQSPYITLLHKLGNPQNKLPPVVHVAGTNGKGSTIAFIQAILEAAGYTVHSYTSPHLITFNERISLAGKPIDDTRLIQIYDHIKAVNDGAPITFFEYTTAMAFVAMAQTPADIVLLETGMGGRLDCTNVIAKPALTIITNIGLDHTEFLGDTLPQIAAEKAGIIKAGVPCIISPQTHADVVLPVFKNAAKILNARLLIAGENFTGIMPKTYPTPNLVGTHQLENAATALEAINQLTLRHCEPKAKQSTSLSSQARAPKNKNSLRSLRLCGLTLLNFVSSCLLPSRSLLAKAGRGSKPFIIAEKAIIHGLTHANWPARMQHITTGPIAALLPHGTELWFDAAHNEAGAAALATQLHHWKTENPQTPIHLVIGLAADKDARAFFAPFKGLYDSLTLVDLPQARKPQTAAELLEKLNIPAITAKDIKTAVTGHNAPNQRIIVAGSLYLYQQI